MPNTGDDFMANGCNMSSVSIIGISHSSELLPSASGQQYSLLQATCYAPCGMLHNKVPKVPKLGHNAAYNKLYGMLFLSLW